MATIAYSKVCVVTIVIYIYIYILALTEHIMYIYIYIYIYNQHCTPQNGEDNMCACVLFACFL